MNINLTIRQLLLTLTVIIFCTKLSYAETIIVPDDVSSINSAIEQSEDGDLILVQPGTYYESINFLGKAITVASRMILDGEEEYIDSTMIAGDRRGGAVVIFDNDEDERSILKGFTIKGGDQSYGGGIDCQENTSPTLEDLLITGNNASNWGGGIYCTWNSAPVIQRVIIENNSAGKGGGIGIVHGAHPLLSDVIIRNNTTNARGGGVWIESDGWCTFNNVTISDNSSGSGGGVYIESESASTFRNVTITDNRAGSGGGIYIKSMDTHSINEIIIEGNSASNEGGGLYCRDSEIIMVNAVFENNSAGDFGGGIFTKLTILRLDSCQFISNEASRHGGGIQATDGSTVKLKSSLFQENIANNWGGGINVLGNSDISIIDCQFIENQADDGGAINCYDGGKLKSDKSHFFSNRASYGAAINSFFDARISLVNTTFVNNEADSVGGSCFMSLGGSVLRVVNSILWDNQPEEIVSISSDTPDIIVIAYSDIMGGSENITGEDVRYDEETNIDSDPLFDEDADQLVLTLESPCVDAGTDYYVMGRDTLVDYSEDQYIGDAPDMGAFEFQPLGVRPIDENNPVEFSIIDAYPNPFNGVLTINIASVTQGLVRLAIYDIRGREVTVLNDKPLHAGESKFTWDAKGYSQGIYFLSLETPTFETYKKVVYLK